MKRKRRPRASVGTVLPGRGALLDLRNNVRWMPVGGQLRDLCVAMCKLFWKMLRVLTPGRFYIPIGNKKPITRIVKLAKASKNSCWKSVTKKSVTLIIKHAVPSVN
jgi:hypothetical protein